MTTFAASGCPYCGWKSQTYPKAGAAWVALVNHMQTCKLKPKEKP